MAQGFIAAMRSGTLAPQRAVIQPQLYDQTLEAVPKVVAVLPVQGAPELVTVNRMTNGFGSNAPTEVTLNYEFGSGRSWVWFQIVLDKAAAKTQIIGWHVQPYVVRPSTAGDFTFEGKGTTHYVWIALMLLSTGTIITALVQLFRTPGLRRRWLWALACMFGVGQFAFNWSTGQWGINPFHIALLGSGFVRASPFDSWVLGFSLPIGAVIFLAKRSDWMAHTAAEAD